MLYFLPGEKSSARLNRGEFHFLGRVRDIRQMLVDLVVVFRQDVSNAASCFGNFCVIDGDSIIFLEALKPRHSKH